MKSLFSDKYFISQDSGLYLYKIIPWFIFGVLFILSQVFYKERIIFLDCSLKLFEVIRNNDLGIQVERYSSAVTQVFPWIAVQLKLPLDWVIRLYSASYIIWYIVVYVLAGYVFKQWKIALAMPLFCVLMCTQTFYWATNELHQGIGFIVLQLALMLSYNEVKNKKMLILSMLNILNILYIHPLAIVVFLSILPYFILNGTKPWNREIYLYVSLGIVALFILKKIFLPATWYDEGISGSLNNFVNLFPYYFTNPSQLMLYKEMLSDYFIWAAISVLVSVTLLYLKKWLLFSHYILISVGYFLLITISFYYELNQFYIESLLLPISFYTVIYVVFELTNVISYKTLVQALLIIIFIRFAQIYSEHSVSTNRLTWMREFMDSTQNQNSRKLLVAEWDAPMKTLLMSWGTPFEFWLLSSIERADQSPRQIIVAQDYNKYLQYLNNNKLFIGTWNNYKFDELPMPYFRFTDTSSVYVEYKK